MNFKHKIRKFLTEKFEVKISWQSLFNRTHIWQVDLLSLDSSCMENFLPAPKIKDAEISGDQFVGDKFCR
jgi:hypothetical protein